MAECCHELRRRRLGQRVRQNIRDDMARWPAAIAAELRAVVLHEAQVHADNENNTPDERRAWAELVKELEGLA